MKSTDPELPENNNDEHVPSSKVIRVSGMYRDYFLDYASYVILERAVPTLEDGLKPVQRRLLHSLEELHDGRYHKVANLIGHTMKYHPHGDASIGDALVQLGQKELLIDCQGNWGNILTGDSSAAPRYIEARLTPFAQEVVFNKKITQWQPSYDGRGKEPIQLPIRFPLLLAQGVEGIAVGLSTKILPHNFNELIDASINVLKGKNFVLYPDFLTGGYADVSNYNDGLKGGKVRVRAKIHDEGNKALVIKDIPFGTTTSSLIDSILKANDKGKIKIKKIEDNTAAEVEIVIYLPPGVSPDKTIDALYAFTDCEVSISPLACVVNNDCPVFIGVSEILKSSTEHTVELLRNDLKLRLSDLKEQWHFSSLERIFIENKIYRDIEEAENWDQVIQFIRKGIEPFLAKLIRPVSDEDIVRLTEIRIKRITKFDSSKADDQILQLEGNMAEIEGFLANMIDYAIDWFKSLKKKYGTPWDRKTELKTFDDIEATKVAMANVKFYVNRQEGFIGTTLKKDEYVFDCSDIDDIIVFRRDGKMMVTKVDQKTFVGQDILHVSVFKKNDDRTIYNMIYLDGESNQTFMKRFPVKGITRDKEYDLTQATPKSKVLYFTANPNGEAEIVNVHLRAIQKLKKLRIDIDFSELAIKGRSSKGNRVTRYPVKKVELKEEGVSTLAPRKIWLDPSVNRLNDDGRGELLGSFGGDDRLVEITKSGKYRLLSLDLSLHLEADFIYLKKWNPNLVFSMIYYDGTKEKIFGKRFTAEEISKPELLVSTHPKSEILYLSTHKSATAEIVFRKERGKEIKENQILVMEEFISVKGFKAQGNQLSSFPIKEILNSDPEPIAEIIEENEASSSPIKDVDSDDLHLDGEGQIILDFE